MSDVSFADDEQCNTAGNIDIVGCADDDNVSGLQVNIVLFSICPWFSANCVES